VYALPLQVIPAQITASGSIFCQPASLQACKPTSLQAYQPASLQA